MRATYALLGAGLSCLAAAASAQTPEPKLEPLDYVELRHAYRQCQATVFARPALTGERASQVEHLRQSCETIRRDWETASVQRELETQNQKQLDELSTRAQSEALINDAAQKK